MLSEDVSQLWDAMKIGPQWLLRPMDASAVEAEVAARPGAASPSASSMAPRSAAAARAPMATRGAATSAAPNARTGVPTRPAPRASLTSTQAPMVQSTVTPMSPETLAAIQKADWAELAKLAEACRACEMGATRQHVALADGIAPSDFVVIGEAPGREEDLQGKPFVGNSGQLLTAMLTAVGFTRPKGVTIINVLKCRPPENRDPQDAEMAACSAYLERQMQLLQPKVVLLSGRFAMMSILGLARDVSITSQRGRIHEVSWHGLTFKAVVTYHPSYLLRRPQEKMKAWDDLLLLKAAMKEVKVSAPAA